MYFLVYIYPNSPLQAGCYHHVMPSAWMVIFKQRKADLNSEFSFFSAGCLTKAKEPSLSPLHEYIYSTPLLWPGYDTRSVFKQSKAG